MPDDVPPEGGLSKPCRTPSLIAAGIVAGIRL